MGAFHVDKYRFSVDNLGYLWITCQALVDGNLSRVNQYHTKPTLSKNPFPKENLSTTPNDLST